MSTPTGSVVAGYTWVEDANGLTQITKDRLNLAAVPVVTVPLSGIIETGDIQASQITAALLADALADLLPGTPTLTVATESSNQIITTIQLKDVQGNSLAAKRHFTWWVAGTSGAVPAATPPSGSTVISTGIELVQYTPKVLGEAVTDANGACAILVEESTSKQFYLSVAIQGIVAEATLDFSLV